MIELVPVFVRVAMDYIGNLHMAIYIHARVFLHMNVIHPFGKIIAIPSVPVGIHRISMGLHKPGEGAQDIRYNRSTFSLIVAYPYRLAQPQLKVGVVGLVITRHPKLDTF
jgi:hypothetical protein